MSNVGLSDEQAESFQAGGGEQFSQLLDPTGLLVGLEIAEVEGGVEWLGRPALRVRGRPRIGQELVHFPGLYMLDSAEARELLVDRERGVVLKVALFLDNEEFSGSSFSEIAFDKQFPGRGLRLRAPAWRGGGLARHRALAPLHAGRSGRRRLVHGLQAPGSSRG